MIKHLNYQKDVLNRWELAERVLRIAAEFCYVPAAREISVYIRERDLHDLSPSELGDFESSALGSGRYICQDASPELVYRGLNRFTARYIENENRP